MQCFYFCFKIFNIIYILSIALYYHKTSHFWLGITIRFKISQGETFSFNASYLQNLTLTFLPLSFHSLSQHTKKTQSSTPYHYHHDFVRRQNISLTSLPLYFNLTPFKKYLYLTSVFLVLVVFLFLFVLKLVSLQDCLQSHGKGCL